MELPDDYEYEEDDGPLPEVQCKCQCGECCRHLIVEVSVADAEREPKIAEKGSPTYVPGELTASGERELVGYLLNTREDFACVFLDCNRCTIYETRPDGCRAFDCDHAGRAQLIQLGILPADGR